MNNNLQMHTILGYDEVAQHSAGDDPEKLVDVRLYDPSIVAEYHKEDMLELTGHIIYIRDTLAKKLTVVNGKLQPRGYQLKVVYGYRHPTVQKKYFNQEREKIKHDFPEYTGSQIDRYAHNFVAIPDVAGHPAGAAVDLTIITREGIELDMATKIADYTDSSKIITYATTINEDQMNHRLLLHDLMVEQGFAPFYGEWWHFSYGDREWAAFYNKKALYGAIEFVIN